MKIDAIGLAMKATENIYIYIYIYNLTQKNLPMRFVSFGKNIDFTNGESCLYYKYHVEMIFDFPTRIHTSYLLTLF